MFMYRLYDTRLLYININVLLLTKIWLSVKFSMTMKFRINLMMKKSVPKIPVSSNEAKLGFRVVLNFLQEHDIDESVFCNILNLDNTINRVSACGYTQ
jgi:hypothetical protein